MSRARVWAITSAFVFAVLPAATFSLLGPRATAADCKSDGTQCATNRSCCSRDCMKPTLSRGVSLFGICCTPTTCAAQGKNCGTIPDGDCTGFFLSCGTCTEPGRLAHVVTSKYADHLPLYRFEQIFVRHGVVVTRRTLARVERVGWRASSRRSSRAGS